MSKHTPGRWTAQHDLRGTTNVRIITDGPFAWGVYGPKMRIANVIDVFTSEDEQAANAVLLAAAPVMLEALLIVEDRINRGWFPWIRPDDVWPNAVRSAIAAALVR
jgi:hypothetical protein